MSTWLDEGEKCLLNAYTLNALDRIVNAGNDYLFFKDVTPQMQRRSEYGREYGQKDGVWIGIPDQSDYGHEYIVRIDDPRMKMGGYVECFVTTDEGQYLAYKAQMKRYFSAALMAKRPNGVLPVQGNGNQQIVALLKQIVTLLEGDQ